MSHPLPDSPVKVTRALGETVLPSPPDEGDRFRRFLGQLDPDRFSS